MNWYRLPIYIGFYYKLGCCDHNGFFARQGIFGELRAVYVISVAAAKAVLKVVRMVSVNELILVDDVQ